MNARDNDRCTCTGPSHESSCKVAGDFGMSLPLPDPDDGKVLIAGVLYDAETGEEAE